MALRGKAKGKVPAGQILVDSFGDEMYRKVRISKTATDCKPAGFDGIQATTKADLLFAQGWWCCETGGDWFLEANSAPWARYFNPVSTRGRQGGAVCHKVP